MKYEHVDLCSGIGGIALGLSNSGLSEPILFCEIDSFCRKVLNKHWPHVPIAHDLKEIANDPDKFIPRANGRKRILTSGFPCQPYSVAGLQDPDDERILYPFISKIIAQVRPDVFILENVPGLIPLAFDNISNDLVSQGFATTTIVFPTGASVGAPHKRERIFIIGKNMDDTQHDGSSSTKKRRGNKENDVGSSQGTDTTFQSQGASRPEDNGALSTNDVAHPNNQGVWSRKRGAVSEPVQKNDAGNYHSERLGSYDCNQDGKPQVVQKNAEDVSDSNVERLQGREETRNTSESRETSEQLSSRCDQPQHVSNANSQRGRSRSSGYKDAEDVGQSPRSQGSGGGNPQLRMGVSVFNGISKGLVGGLTPWEPEPTDIPRVAVGQKDRVAKLKAVGNAVVVQAIERIGLAIKAGL